MSAFLPQHDPNRIGRDALLGEARRKYQFNFTHLSPLAMIERVPVEDEFSMRWVRAMGESVLTDLQNHLLLESDSFFAAFLRSKHGLLARMLTAGAELIGGLRHFVGEALRFAGRQTAQPTRPDSIEEYGRLFRSIGLPPIARDYREDAAFAAMRVAGPNPVMIRKVDRLDDRFPVTEEIYRSVMLEDSLAAAAAEGRLFLADYQVLEGVEVGNYPWGQKYLYCPLALFAVDRFSHELTPVAIQCKQAPGPDNPIFTPADGTNWLIAKTVVEIADGNVHEAVTHLARTHLLAEPFVIATRRQLAVNHPLSALLLPHFEGTLAINDMAWKHLVSDRGPVEKLLAGSITGTRKLAVHGLQTYVFCNAYLPKALAARGVDDTTWLKNYPYRDDASLYWDAIRAWVEDYVNLYYPAEAELAADTELAAWFAELADEKGGRLAVVGFTAAPGSKAHLIEVLTLVIFTCSVQHAAVNFPQYDLMSYAPNMPLAGYAPAPTSKTGATERDYLAMLPPLDMAELQLDLGFMLGTLHYTALGEYGPTYFSDPRVAEPLGRFRARIAEIGRVIAVRNKSRRPYEYLTPAGVPQSINV